MVLLLQERERSLEVNEERASVHKDGERKMKRGRDERGRGGEMEEPSRGIV